MKFRQALFWDTDPDKIDTEKNAVYILERILELGSDEEVRWAKKQYDENIFQKVIETSRSLSPKTRNLWQILMKKA